MLKWFLHIRLTVLAAAYVLFFVIFLHYHTPAHLTSGQLALFSVNSFLFGYYFSPLLSAQKSRVAALNTAGRQEAMTLLDILTQSHMLGPAARHQLKVRLRTYLDSVVGSRSVSADNPYYDELLYWTKRPSKEDAGVLNTIYNRVTDTQKNRDAMANLFASPVYSHEWMVASVLFAITLYFALQTNYGNSAFFGLLLAVLCAGLCMLMTILMKFATLSHKEAQRMWDPLKDLRTKHFDDVSDAEVAEEKARIDQYVQTKLSPATA